MAAPLTPLHGTLVANHWSRAVLSNPVAIRHMWRQGVFPEAVLQSKHQLNCCFIGLFPILWQQQSLCCHKSGECGDKELWVGLRWSRAMIPSRGAVCRGTQMSCEELARMPPNITLTLLLLFYCLIRRTKIFWLLRCC